MYMYLCVVFMVGGERLPMFIIMISFLCVLSDEEYHMFYYECMCVIHVQVIHTGQINALFL